MRARSLTFFTSQLCLVHGRVMPTVSHSWKASLPIRCVGTWPVMHTSGMESISASVSPVTAVGRAGAGGDERDADLAGRARIAFGRVQRAAFLADEDVLDLVLLEQLVVDRQHGAAGIAENVLDALIDERLDHHLGARHRTCHCQLHRCGDAAARSPGPAVGRGT